MPKPAGAAKAASALARGACKGVSGAAIALFGTVYFVALSAGALGWAALACAPWLAGSARGPLSWVCCGLALAAFAATGARIQRRARPLMGKVRPGGSWIAWAMVGWLAWIDAALGIGRELPACLESGSLAVDAVGLRRLAWGFARAGVELPARSMACFWTAALMAAMPIGVHLAFAAAVPAAILAMAMPRGPGIGLLERVKRVAQDLAKEGTEEWAQAERAELDKAIAQPKEEGPGKRSKRGPEGKGASDGPGSQGPKRL